MAKLRHNLECEANHPLSPAIEKEHLLTKTTGPPFVVLFCKTGRLRLKWKEFMDRLDQMDQQLMDTIH